MDIATPVDREFSVSVESNEGTAVFRLCGELDMNGIPDLKAAFDDWGADSIIVDLRNLTFIDSMGLGALVSAAKASADDGRSPIRFIPGPGPVHRVFELTNVDSFLEWVDVV